jgi:hypothetical protein
MISFRYYAAVFGRRDYNEKTKFILQDKTSTSPSCRVFLSLTILVGDAPLFQSSCLLRQCHGDVVCDTIISS